MRCPTCVPERHSVALCPHTVSTAQPYSVMCLLESYRARAQPLNMNSLHVLATPVQVVKVHILFMPSVLVLVMQA